MPTAPQTITPLPTPVPTRQDPVNFNARADATLAQLPDTIADMNAVAANVYANAVEADADAVTADAAAAAAAISAAAAAASAASALNAPGTSATSTTSLAIGTGSKSLTIQTGKAFSVGQIVLLAAGTAGNWMIGQITAHDSGTGALTVNVTQTAGSGSHAAWTVTPTAPHAALQWLVVSGAQTLTPYTRIALDVSSGTPDENGVLFSLTMPPAPPTDAWLMFCCDAGDLRAARVKLLRNGELMPGEANGPAGAWDFLIDSNVPFLLVYRGASKGWRLAL